MCLLNKRIQRLTIPLCLILGLIDTLSAQGQQQFNLPVKHGYTSTYNGPGADTYQYNGRLFHFENPNSLVVNSYTDYDNYLNDETGPAFYQDDYDFAGSAVVDGGLTTIRMPASYGSSYLYRELTIRADGHITKDRYYNSSLNWMEYHYYYNAQGIMTEELRMKQVLHNPLLVNYRKTAITLDNEYRRVSETIVTSTDSLSWVPYATKSYTYTGDPTNVAADFEIYNPYLPKDYGLLATNENHIPYMCNGWKLNQMSYVPAGSEPVIYTYLHGSSGLGAYYYSNDFQVDNSFQWSSLGQLLSSSRTVDVNYLFYSYLWQSITVANSDPEIPAVQAGLEVYPNPFNPSTTVRYMVPEASEPVFTIYNLKGQKVRVCKPGACPAGTYELVFDGRDENGTALPSGVYLLRMNLGSCTMSKRITLLK